VSRSDVEEPHFPHPIFAGGSARSGTHAVGRLLGSHPRYHLLEGEVRLHSSPGGLTDLLSGKTNLDSFCERILNGDWWQRGLWGQHGLRKLVDRDALVAAIEAFRAGYGGAPWEAGRRLVHAILDPVAEGVGKPAWVEVSGWNISQGPALAKLFPRARFIHTVRDGRAVVAAILRHRPMTDDRAAAFRHWVERVRLSYAGIEKMPAGTIETISLEELAAFDREGAFERLVRLLELDDPKPMREYFERKISAERAHVGAWRERIAPADVRWLDRRYRRILRRLRNEGIDWIPEPGRESRRRV
jgi:hypothetical protein